MSTMRDEPTLRAVADVIKAQVGKAFATLAGRIETVNEDLRKQISEIPHGKDGASGEKGEPGAQGEKGIDGADGLPGVVGESGPVGQDGKDGAPGIDGAKGLDGKDGLAGKDGAPGVDGAKGIDGKDGAPGKDGIKGLDGASGKDGINGKDGRDGIDGKDGAPGLIGKSGADGRDGKDAEPIDKDALSAAIVEKVLTRIPPPINGVNGKDGTSVDAEQVRAMIYGEVQKAVGALPKPQDGRDGLVGPQGLIGKQGPEGPSGRDALAIDIQRGMNEEMSYPRGQYVAHRNGFFYSYRTTDPVVDKNFEAAGWQVIFAGVVDMHEATAADGRTVVTSHELSDGKLLTTQRKVAATVYRHAWKEGKSYEQGDVVTWGGSTWHANRDTGAKPGYSDDWTLMVRRGADAKSSDAKSRGAFHLNGAER